MNQKIREIIVNGLRKRVKGSYTIEAAYIVPFVIFIIIGIVYLGFYLHDRNKIKIIMNEALVKAESYVMSEVDLYNNRINYEMKNDRSILYAMEDNLEDREEQVRGYVVEQLQKGFFIASSKEVMVELSHSGVEISIDIMLEIPIAGVNDLFRNSMLLVKEEKKKSFQNNVEYIRIFDIFSGVASKTELGDQALTQLQRVLEGVVQ